MHAQFSSIMRHILAPAFASLVSFATRLMVLVRQPRWQPAMLFAAGLLGALAMAPFHLFPLLVLPYTFLLLALRQPELTRRRAFFLSFMTGFGIHLGGLFWIANAMLVANSPFLWAYPFALTGLPILFALYHGVVGLLFRRFLAKKNPPILAQWLYFSVLIALMEYVRGFLFTGYPWNLPGYGWMELPVVQSLALFGPYALTLLTILLASVPALFYGSTGWQWRNRTALRVSGAMVLIFMVLGAGGMYRLTQKTDIVPHVRVAVIQPNIDQGEKWDGNKRKDHFNKLLRLSRPRDQVDQAANDKMATLIVWPETALSGSMLDSDAAIKAFENMLDAHGAQTTLFSGTLRSEEDESGKRAYFNSLMSWRAGMTNDLTPQTIYDKSHLVPFGEYMPFEKQLNLSPVVGYSGFAAGGGVTTQKVPGAPPFSPLICYEVVFPHAVVDQNNRPGWMLNVTNDGWYGNSPGPYQHWELVRARSIEEGLPSVRSANTGISGVIDGYGRIIAKAGYNEAAALYAPLPKALPPTPYAQYGELFFAALLMLIYGLARVLCISKAHKIL